MAERLEFPFADQKQASVIGLASPKDRIAAYILDCVLVLPLVQLFQAPVKKWILESVLFNEALSASYFRVINLIIFIVVFIAYYTAMTYWRGQTVGKIFFRIRVISYVGSLSLAAAFLRSISIFGEFLAFGLPFFSMFSHPLRRPMHDRLADTLVISVHNPVGIPDRREKIKVAVLTTTLGLLFASMGLMYSTLYFQSPSSESETPSRCDAMATAENGLDSALELFLAKEIDAKCLREEARDHLWKRENLPIAQFAMAIAVSEDQKLSDDYLSSICREESDHYLCDFSKWLVRFAHRAEIDIVQLESIIHRPRVDNFAKILALGFLRSEGQYEKMEVVLRTMQKTKEVEPLMSSMTLISLLGQFKWDEAFWVYKTHENLSDNDILKFLNFEIQNQFIGQDEQQNLIEYFYPGLVDYNSRSPASIKDYPSEIREIYLQFKEEK